MMFRWQDHPELVLARKEGAEAHNCGMSQESNPYTDHAEKGVNGQQWHWSDAWWQEHCDVTDRANVRAN